MTRSDPGFSFVTLGQRIEQLFPGLLDLSCEPCVEMRGWRPISQIEGIVRYATQPRADGVPNLSVLIAGRFPKFVYPAYERIAVSAQRRDLASNGLCLINVELIYIELLQICFELVPCRS